MSSINPLDSMAPLGGMYNSGDSSQGVSSVQDVLNSVKTALNSTSYPDSSIAQTISGLLSTIQDIDPSVSSSLQATITQLNNLPTTAPLSSVINAINNLPDLSNVNLYGDTNSSTISDLADTILSKEGNVPSNLNGASALISVLASNVPPANGDGLSSLSASGGNSILQSLFPFSPTGEGNTNSIFQIMSEPTASAISTLISTWKTDKSPSDVDSWLVGGGMGDVAAKILNPDVVNSYSPSTPDNLNQAVTALGNVFNAVDKQSGYGISKANPDYSSASGTLGQDLKYTASVSQIQTDIANLLKSLSSH